jgi:hypothetical protein
LALVEPFLSAYRNHVISRSACIEPDFWDPPQFDVVCRETNPVRERNMIRDEISSDRPMNTSGKNTNAAILPVSLAFIIAVAGTAAMFLFEFRSNDGVAHNGISMVTSAAAERAGATARPTDPVAR